MWTELRQWRPTQARFLRLVDPPGGPIPPVALCADLTSLELRGGGFDSIPREALDGPDAPFRVALDHVQLPWEALLEQLVVDGSGRWRISRVTGAPRAMARKLKAACRLGQDFLGEARLRHLALTLSLDSVPERPPTMQDLTLAQARDRTVRQRALVWFAASLPRPPRLAAGQAVVLLGRPCLGSSTQLKQALTAAGLRVVRSPAQASHAVLLQRPGPALAEAQQSGLVMLFEPWLRELLQAAREPGLEIDEGQVASLAQMLSNADDDVVHQALFLAEQVKFDLDLLPELLVVMLFHRSAALRRSAKALFNAHAPQPLIDRFMGDRSRWTGVSNVKKVRGLVEELGVLGVDRRRFALGMAVKQVQRGEWNLAAFIRATEGLVPLKELLEALDNPRRSYLNWTGDIPAGFHHLQVEVLNLFRGPVDLSPLAGSPVRVLTLHAEALEERPWDLAPLIRCPALRQVKCTPNRHVHADRVRARLPSINIT